MLVSLFSNIHSVTVTFLEVTGTLECSILFYYEDILVVCPFNSNHWHSSRSDVRSFPGCILLGVAASGYNIFFMDMREPKRAEE
jgi:hypothetical protein